MTPAAECLANRANVHLVGLRTHAHANFAVRQLLEKNRDNDSADGAQMIDQPLVIFGQDPELFRAFEAQTKARDAAFGVKAHRSEEITQQLDSPARIVFVGELADLADIHPGADELACDLKRSRGGVWILERTGVR